MTAFLILLALPIGCALVLVVAARLIEHADAEQGPPPTRRPARPTTDDLMPLGLDSGVREYEAAAEAAWLEHVAEALVLAEKRGGRVIPMQRRGQ